MPILATAITGKAAAFVMKAAATTGKTIGAAFKASTINISTASKMINMKSLGKAIKPLIPSKNFRTQAFKIGKTATKEVAKQALNLATPS